MEVKYYGHSCFEVKLAGKSMLFDPFISPNPLASGVDIASIRPDVMFVSHGHIDHVADALEICKQSNPLVVGIWETCQWFERNGHAHCHAMNIGGSWEFDFGMVKLANAVHSSSFPDGSTGGNPCGFIIKTAEKTVYYAGDTALHMDMQLIAKRFKVDVAFLPIGSNFTMDVEDAIEAARMVQVKKVVGMHYDTFGYIKIDHDAARKAFTVAGLELVIPEINQPFNV